MMADKLFTKCLRDLTDEAIRESLAEISVEIEKRFGPAALTASPPVVTPKWDVCRNCVDGSKAGQTCTVCEGRGHVPFVPTPVSPPVVEREAIVMSGFRAITPVSEAHAAVLEDLARRIDDE